MSEATQEAPTETTATVETVEVHEEQRPKPTETVDFWKQKAREQESRAKANKAAADRLAELEESQKSDAQKAADRIANAEREVASVPAKVADALKSHLVALHEINEEDAELFLTASDPELLLKQVGRLTARAKASEAERKKQGNYVPREGANPNAPENDEREAARRLFGAN